MKFKKIDFIDFESKNILTQKTFLVITMGILVYYFYTMVTTVASVFILVFKSGKAALDLTELMQLDWFVIFSLFATAIGIIITLLYVRFLERRPLKSTGIVKKRIIPQYISGYLLGILMISVPVLVLFLFDGKISFTSAVDYKILSLYFFGFIIQGASEEIMMRGYFLTSLAKSTKITWAVIISSVAFSMLHLLNPGISILAFANLVLFGVFAALFFLRTKNIWAICGVHSAWNFFQGNVFGIKVSGQNIEHSVLSVTSSAPDILSGGNFGLEGGLIVTSMLVLSSVIILFCGKNKLIVKTTDEPFSPAAV